MHATPVEPVVSEKYAEYILILLTFSAFISISVFQALIVLALCLTLYSLFAESKRPSGILLFPFSLYAVPTFLSTALFNPSYLVKSLDQALFSFLYCFKEYINPNNNVLLKINRMLVWVGIILIPVIAYRFIVQHRISVLSGGPFEMGLFFTLFSLASLSLYFFSRKILYLFLFPIFSSIVFFSTKRAPVIGFAVALILFILMVRRFMSRGFVFVIAAGFILASVIAVTILIQKDMRFQALSRVLTGEAGIDDEYADKIVSFRWGNFKAGITIVKNDLANRNITHILLGHGIHPGMQLNPQPVFGTNYESLSIISEFIERGLVGLAGMLFVYLRYATFLFRFRVTRTEDFLKLPLLLVPSAHMAGTIFTFFWDARLPLYYLFFGLIEKRETSHRLQGR
jgi:hypothetical protein